jgi:ATP-dependent DNA helicase RecG
MLAAKRLLTVADLLYYAPFRYEDRTNVKTINQLAPGEKAAVMVRVESAKLSGFRRKSLGLFEVTFRDAGSDSLLARWFHGERYADSLVPDARVALFGKVELDRSSGHRLMVQPEVEMLSSDDEHDETLHSGRIVPVYEAASKISTRVFRSLLHRILSDVPLPDDPLPDSVRARINLPSLGEALQQIHNPDQDSDLRLLN